MSYKELADSLRMTGAGDTPSGDVELVRGFSPDWLSERLLDIIVAHSTSIESFNSLLKMYCDWKLAK